MKGIVLTMKSMSLTMKDVVLTRKCGMDRMNDWFDTMGLLIYTGKGRVRE